MKRLLLVLSAGLASGCWYSPGERSVFWEEDGSVTIERSMTADLLDVENWQTGSCIAVPSDWTGDITVSISGTQQSGGVEQAFTATSAAYDAGTTEIAGLLPLPDLTWHCYADIARDYGPDSTGTITYQLMPESDAATVVTTIGVLSDDADKEYYYQQQSSHQLLRSDTVDAYWMPLGDVLIGDGSQTLQTLDVGSTRYYFGSVWSGASDQASRLYQLTDDGVTALADIPRTETLLRVNDLYFSLSAYTADIDGNNQTWTDVRYSSDLATWSEPATLPHLHAIYWDAVREEYVAAVEDSYTPIEKGVYTSTDLSSWTYANWVDLQTVYFAFLSNGRAFAASSNSYPTPFHQRAAESDTWEVADIIPQKVGESQTHQFLFTGMQVIDDVIHVVGYRRFLDGSTVTNDDVFYGQSSDGENWSWHDLGSYAELGYPSEFYVMGSEIFVSTGNRQLLRSLDNGDSWTEVSSAATALVENTELYAAESIWVRNVVKQGGQYVLTVMASLKDGEIPSLTALISTSDFAAYQLLAVSNGQAIVPNLSALTFTEQVGGQLRAQQLQDAAADNDGDYLSDAIDPDDDNDGVPDEDDALPFDATESVDTDGDGIGNNADTDDDNDGVPDTSDRYPLDSERSKKSSKGGALFWLPLLILPLAVRRRTRG
ncbi:hypothetical protein ACQUQU_15660 [Thalassolituus sp. LLYu03]|uniref:hypothetical protein n=1 Tax=Thalassolituus sp. LLYu03 TaxID=3421656 RepID=UPI003D2E08F1